MDAITWIAEQKISAAISEGAFDDLPGKGKPLVMSNNTGTGIYPVLSNAGFLPKVLSLRREIECLHSERKEIYRKCSVRLKQLDMNDCLNLEEWNLQRKKCLSFFSKKLADCIEIINLKTSQLNSETIQNEVLQKRISKLENEFLPVELQPELEHFNRKFNQ